MTENDVTLVVNKALTDKILWLENRVKHLEAELNSARELSLESSLAHLRMHQVVFVSFAHNYEELQKTLINIYGSDFFHTLMRHLFFLDDAPLSHEQKTAVKIAFNGGNSRW